MQLLDAHRGVHIAVGLQIWDIRAEELEVRAAETEGTYSHTEP